MMTFDLEDECTRSVGDKAASYWRPEEGESVVLSVNVGGRARFWVYFYCELQRSILPIRGTLQMLARIGGAHCLLSPQALPHSRTESQADLAHPILCPSTRQWHLWRCDAQMLQTYWRGNRRKEGREGGEGEQNHSCLWPEWWGQAIEGTSEWLTMPLVVRGSR